MNDPASKPNSGDQTAGVPPLPIAARRHPVIAEARRQLQREAGYVGGPIVLAVSGGVDSVALLLTFLAFREQPRSFARPVQPLIAHVHHHLREEADLDAAHVRDLAARFSLPFARRDVDPGACTGNLPEASRTLRYRALIEIAREHGAAWIATAHHAEDQLETMLMNMARGAGMDGLSGMRPARALEPGVTLARPLLGQNKSACRAVCERAGVTWRDDASNQDRTRSRNRLRAEVLPVLQQLWPGAALRANATAEQCAWAATLMDRELDRVFGDPAHSETGSATNSAAGSAADTAHGAWTRAWLRSQPPALLAAGFRRWALRHDPAVTDCLRYETYRQIAAAIHDDELRPRRFALGSGLTVAVTAREVILRSDGVTK